MQQLMSPKGLLVATFALFIIPASEGAGNVPEQIHISSTGKATEMVIMWTTFDTTSSSMVQYGEHGVTLSKTSTGKMKKFVDGGQTHSVRYMHTVTLTGLKPATKYDYKVGCSDKWSDTFTMTTLNDGTDWSPRLAIYGDMGLTNARSMPRLLQETNDGNFDAILHIGDIAYNMDFNEGKVGDDFMNMIQDIATQVPYMTAVGNHEYAYNFSHYINRFSMPGDRANFYYSWDVGNAHFVVFSTEVYFFFEYTGVKIIGEQYKWLEQTLKAANSKTPRPWIITAGHRPMYCSTNDGDDCNDRNSIVRTGFSDGRYALEPLFKKYGVDIALWAHEHDYQRMWPVYDRVVYNGSESHPYVDPKAPVHITTGSAGADSLHDHFSEKMPWDAVRHLDYGYSRMTVLSTTHVKWQQISDDQGGAVIDEIDIVRTKGKPSWI